MCGIAGVISRSVNGDAFDLMSKTIAHRGPDAHTRADFHAGPWHIALGHHRLSIIDVAGGAQPMTSGSDAIVFNGEIYGYERLRELLPGRGWRTRSDTEVVLELVRAKGPEALAAFDGFFALAVCNSERREVLLARDRWGIKPLYFAALPDGGLMFASELHPFLRSPHICPQVSLQTLSEYLFWEHVPFDHTFLEGVHKLRPGHYLHWLDGKIRIEAYYDHSALLTQPRRQVKPEEVWQTVQNSVREAMIADVPVGILLSGGIDSSLIAAAAHQISGPGLPTFSIGFADPEFDESPQARLMAQTIRAEHHELKISSSDLLERWEEIVTGLDEPLADPSLLPTRLVCELAREHVPVVLGGDGGDELFGGYPTYRAHRLRGFLDLLPAPAFASLQALVRQLKLTDGYQPLTWKLKRLIERYDKDPVAGHFRWLSGTDAPALSQLAQRRYVTPERAELTGRQDPQNFLYLDLLHYLPYTVLTKVDRASMSVGLECRPPLLSNACVEEAFRIPPEQKFSARQTKQILREAARPYVPADLLQLPKRGFAIPLAKWLRGELAPHIASLLNDSPLWGEKALDRPAAQRMWSEFKSGRGDHAKTFWALLVAHKWCIKNSVSIMHAERAS